ncbi:MAG: hypothetical protein J0I13_01500 [Rhizobiales bacterium]|nr:hypothetical protein [Hyphomicrobiales bacterium]
MSDTTTIPTRASVMLEDMRQAIGIVIGLPDGPQIFQQHLIEAAQDTRTDVAAMTRAISLANAALAVATTPESGHFAPWFREQAQILMRRAMDILDAADAQDRPQSDCRLN